MKPTPESSTQEVLAGLVERVTFHNAENGFCVLRANARGHRDLVIAIAVRNVSGRRRWSKLDEWLRLGRPARHSMRRWRAAAGLRSGSFQRQAVPIGAAGHAAVSERSSSQAM